MADWKAPDGAETGLEEMRTSVLSDWLGTCSLAFVPGGRTVRVSRVPADEVRERLVTLGIEPGASIECVAHTGGRVLVRLPSGREVALDRRDAWVVQVTPPSSVSAECGEPAQQPRERGRRWRRGPSRRDG